MCAFKCPSHTCAYALRGALTLFFFPPLPPPSNSSKPPSFPSHTPTRAAHFGPPQRYPHLTCLCLRKRTRSWRFRQSAYGNGALQHDDLKIATAALEMAVLDGGGCYGYPQRYVAVTVCILRCFTDLDFMGPDLYFWAAMMSPTM